MSEQYRDAVKKVAEILKKELVGKKVGLGSGRTVARILQEIGKVEGTFIPTSMQIQNTAEEIGLHTYGKAIQADVHIDGADQVDKRGNMIKGGGGALLREKVMMRNSSKRYVVIDEGKHVEKLCVNNVPVPVEVSPFAVETVMRKLRDLASNVILRKDSRGYPFITENCNLVVDSFFEPVENPAEIEDEIKKIPGVCEVGVFTEKPVNVFVLKRDGSYDYFEYET